MLCVLRPIGASVGNCKSGTTVCIFWSKLHAREAIREFGSDLVLKALAHPGQTFGSGGLQVQGGIATYNHWTEERYPRIDPINGVYKMSTVRVPRPNTHQLFIRWRRQAEHEVAGKGPEDYRLRLSNGSLQLSSDGGSSWTDLNRMLPDKQLRHLFDGPPRDGRP